MSNSTQVAELLQQGIAAVKAGRKEEARQALLRVIELDEQNEHAWLWLSGVVESLEDRRVCLENVLAINPHNANAQAGLRWLDQQAPALPATETQEDTCPHCGALLPSSGTVCPDCGQPLIVACPACGQYVDVAEASCPDCGQHIGDFRQGAGYHLALAQAYLEHNRHDLVQEVVARAEAAASDDPQALESVAALHENMGRADLATAAYERIIELAPENATAYARLGAIYHRRGTLAEARAMYEQAAERASNNPEILFGLAQLYVQQDEALSEALKLLERVVRLDPEHVQAHLLLGDLNLDRKRRKQARRHYERASELTSPDSQVGQEARQKLARSRLSPRQEAQTVWAGPGMPAYAKPRERPGCVTLYAVLLAIVAVLGILGTTLTGISLLAGSSLVPGNRLPPEMQGSEAILGAVIAVPFFMSIFNFVLAVGLWRLKNWARIAIIVLQTLGFLGNSAYAVITATAIGDVFASTEFQWVSAALICGMLLGLGINGYIIFWFAVNGDYFD